MNRDSPRPWPAKVIDLASRRARRSLFAAAHERGWRTQAGALDWTPRTPLHLYVHDTGDAQLVSGVLNWEDWDEAVAVSEAFSATEVRNDIVTLLRTEAHEHGAGERTLSRNEVLLILLARYASDTETFRRIPWGSPATHFVVLVYRPDGIDAPGILRPFAFFSPDREGLLRPEELIETAARIVRQDRLAHPEWFGPGRTQPLFPTTSP